MNPATADLVAAIAAGTAPETVLLPNTPNVLMAAEAAAGLAGKPVAVVPSRSIQAGLAAMVAFDPAQAAAGNARAMNDAIEGVATGAVTTASRPVALDGAAVEVGSWLGLVEGEPVAGGGDFEQVAEDVAGRLLDGSRGLLILIAGEGRPPLEPLLARLAERHPDV